MSRQSRQGRMNAHYWRNEVQKAQLGDNIANHMAYIFMEILYDNIEEEHWDLLKGCAV